MSFPFNYTGEVIFYKPDYFDDLRVNKQLSVIHKVQTLASFPLQVSIKPVIDKISIQVLYKISLFELNIIFLFVMLGVFFLNYIDKTAWAWAFLIFGSGFYLVNLMHVSRKIKVKITKILGFTDDQEANQLWKKQQLWMKNKNLCPACGEPKNPYANKCVNCGLYFTKKALPYKNSSLTLDSDVIIEYKPKKP